MSTEKVSWDAMGGEVLSGRWSRLIHLTTWPSEYNLVETSGKESAEG